MIGIPKRAPGAVKSRKYKDIRPREYLTPAEVKLLRAAARKSRNGLRDEALVFLLYRHAMRAGEAINLTWEQVMLKERKMYIRRLKNGKSTTHYLESDELSVLRELRKHNPDTLHVFSTNKNNDRLALRTVYDIVAKAGINAGIKFPVHPHMLRHSKGYQLRSQGHDIRDIQDYMGHKQIQHTVRYTEGDPTQFRGFGKDD